MRTSKTVNGVTTNYTINGINVIKETNGTDTLWYYYDASGNVISFELNGTAYFYVKNLQGDITAIIDSDGDIVVEYVYDSWGKLISITGSLADTVGVKNPYRYRGYRYDTELGMYYLQSRYYDPAVKRFINADGFVSTGQGILGNNMFAYCQNNPVNFADPTGEISETLLLIIAFAAAVLIGGLSNGLWALANEQNFWGGFASGAIQSGCIAAALLLPIPTGTGYAMLAGGLGGALGGGFGNVAQSLIEGEPITAEGIAVSSITGAITGSLSSGIGYQFDHTVPTTIILGEFFSSTYFMGLDVGLNALGNEIFKKHRRDQPPPENYTRPRKGGIFVPLSVA